LNDCDISKAKLYERSIAVIDFLFIICR